jgi:hypothetical protein
LPCCEESLSQIRDALPLALVCRRGHAFSLPRAPSNALSLFIGVGGFYRTTFSLSFLFRNGIPQPFFAFAGAFPEVLKAKIFLALFIASGALSLKHQLRSFYLEFQTCYACP